MYTDPQPYGCCETSNISQTRASWRHFGDGVALSPRKAARATVERATRGGSMLTVITARRTHWMATVSFGRRLADLWGAPDAPICREPSEGSCCAKYSQDCSRSRVTADRIASRVKSQSDRSWLGWPVLG
jgi:hypothetical protein